MKKMIMFMLLFFLAVGIFCACNASATNIIVDGDRSDWASAGISPILTDPIGDYSPDFKSLWLANNGEFLYFLCEFAEMSPTSSLYLLMDTDANAGTGYPVRDENGVGIGMEYGITLSERFSYIGDARDGSWGDDFNGALYAVFNKGLVEASVPIDVLRILSPDVEAIDIIIHNDRGPIGRYKISCSPVPIPGTVWFFGAGLVSLLSFRRKL